MTKRRKRPQSTRQYPREARLNELLRQIIASELDRIDDPRLEMATINEVSTDRDLTLAQVFVGVVDESEDEEVLDALDEHDRRLRRAINDQARLRRTPPLRFQIDQTMRSAERIDEILRGIPPTVTGEGSTETDGTDGAD